MQVGHRERIWFLAVIVMLSDHIGLFLVGNEDLAYALRLVGRLGLPLWGWMVLHGVTTTRNLREYGFRMFTVAMIASIPYFALTGKVFNPIHVLLISGILTGIGKPELCFLVAAILGPMGIDPWFAISIGTWGMSYKFGTIDRGLILQVIALTIYSLWTIPENMLGILGVFAIVILYTKEHVPVITGKLVRYSIYPAHLLGIAALKLLQ